MSCSAEGSKNFLCASPARCGALPAAFPQGLPPAPVPTIFNLPLPVFL